MEQQKTGFAALKGLDLPEGLIAIGEYRGYDIRESKGKNYYKFKVLIRDTVKKYDIKPDQVVELEKLNIKLGQMVAVGYYEFQGQFGVNSVLTDYAAL